MRTMAMDQRLERLVEMKSNRFCLEGTVTAVKRDAICVDVGHRLIDARLSGPMRHFHVRVLPTDSVVVVPSTYDRRGRIIWRK
jgi:translation initiation factor IF-1